MKKVRALLIALLAFACLMSAEAQAYKYQSVEGDPMHARIYTLPNGLKVYLTVNKEKPRIQTFIAVRTGSRNDPAETTGLAHYLEHLMFKGTTHFGTSNLAAEAPLLDSIENRFEQYRHIADPQKRKAFYAQIDSISQLAARYNIPNEYDKLMSSIGAEGTNAYTSNDVTCYTEDIPANEVENWAKIQSDRFQNMVIRGFHTELEAVYEEYNIGLASDGRKMWNAMSKKLYPTHPYGTQTTIGTQEHLKNPSIVNIKNYFKRYYVPNNVAICMSGDLDPDKVMATIEKYFGTWKPSAHVTQPEYAPVRDLTAPTDTTVVGQESEFITLAWKFDKAASLQNDTLNVVAEMLSNGKAGLFDLDLDQKMKWLGGGVGVSGMAEYTTFLMQGMPKQGQTLDEVKALMLGEIAKLKKGEFDDDLLPSVVNNMKLAYYKSLESNADRASKFVDAFINRQKWSDAVGSLNRISKMTKAQVIAFANRHLLDNYVAVYKVQGEDTTLKKIDKPHITAIPTNRDKQSQFVTDIINSHVDPIKPVFVDYNHDITRGKTMKGMPILYVKNTDNGLFSLSYKYDFGKSANKFYESAADYVSYLGTDNMSAEQIKKQFYKLACDWKVDAKDNSIYVTLSGLNENMPQALALMNEVIGGLKADKAAYNEYVALVKKSRADQMANQRANFSALRVYGQYGPDVIKRTIITNKECEQTDPQMLVDLIRELKGYQYSVLYYGPSELKDVTTLVNKADRTRNRLLPPLKGVESMELTTPKNEIFIAPYEAKNIYMVQYHNDNHQWNPANQPVISLFNEYFGGGMNTVVFQELRESRGLAYSASAYYVTPYRKGHPEYAQTYIISQNDKMMDCIRVFNHIIDTIPQSDKAFKLAKQALLKRIATERTSKKDLIDSYISAQERGIDYDMNEKVYNAVPSLTLQDLVRFERQTMAGKTYRYMILGDEKNLDMQSLGKIGSIHRVSTAEIFGY